MTKTAIQLNTSVAEFLWDLIRAVYKQTQTRMAASSTSEGGPNAVLVNVAQNTTLHGVPNAYHARSWIRKAIWSSLFLASCGEFDSIAVIYIEAQEFDYYFSVELKDTLFY